MSYMQLEVRALTNETEIAGEKPHVLIQWKGTDVCADIHCGCGKHSHFDGDFMYFIRCPYCQHVWEVGSHVQLYEPLREYDPESVATAQL
jgi:hypothetical protein